MVRHFHVPVFVRILFLAAPLALLSGCINLIEFIGKDANGNTHVSMAITVSKSIVALASQSGESSSALFGSMDATMNDLKKSLPPGIGVKVEKIDDSQLYGYNINFDYPESTLKDVKPSDTSVVLFPIHDGSNIVIHLNTSPEKTTSQESQDTSDAAALFASSQFQLLVSKSYTKQITGAVFTDAKNSVQMTRLDFGEFYLLEMPIMFIMQEQGDAKITIHTS